MQRFLALTFLYNILNVTANNTNEQNTLELLYNKTNINNTWINQTNWLSNDISYCEWYGVTCNEKTITELNLASNGLSGMLDNSLSELKELNLLDLSFNNLHGTIPILNKMRRLQSIKFIGTRLYFSKIMRLFTDINNAAPIGNNFGMIANTNATNSNIYNNDNDNNNNLNQPNNINGSNNTVINISYITNININNNNNQSR
jgi:hypothetical protein